MIAHQNKANHVDTAWRQFKMIDIDVLPYILYHLFTKWECFGMHSECLYTTDKSDFLEPMWAQEDTFLGILAKASGSLLNLKQLAFFFFKKKGKTAAIS